ncbi:hypothetical protein SUGI_0854590 [Cryptomeria japonica]|uniref:heavy metal-associated isoprenylated plant protein 30-like n=1 Tax=Cryptomeria japonica TaxID=3369 RepID=UPI002414AE4B|nr:heavy metal-associated isoprenylated plant protein 30-like [Cryptomeria japonica]GLJ41283.1 hypothetical protein SUGI_0854590 [Cryptomeria japonica]
MTIVELQVNMDCSGCERKVRKALSNLKGIDSVDIDLSMQKVTVSGYIGAKKVLKAVRRSGKQAELWPYPYDSEHHPYTEQYFEKTTYNSSYNYYKHGYNGSTHGYFQAPSHSTIIDDKSSHLFSDDNPHACIVM